MTFSIQDKVIKPNYIPFRLLNKKTVQYRISIIEDISSRSKNLLKKLSWVFNRDPNDETIPNNLLISIYVRGPEPFKTYSDEFHKNLDYNINQIETLNFSLKVEYDDRVNADFLKTNLFTKIDLLKVYYEILKISRRCISSSGLYYYDCWLEDQHESWIVRL